MLHKWYTLICMSLSEKYLISYNPDKLLAPRLAVCLYCIQITFNLSIISE